MSSSSTMDTNGDEKSASTPGGATDSSSSSSPPRLMIKKIVMNNFKSYAGQRVIGPFHKCFSAVVGPNGSGKSNVIDGLLFVFGKRANKIRLKKLSELIHNSENHQDCESCSVSVHFHDIIDAAPSSTGGAPELDYTVVPDSDFVITRTANKKSTSTYYINDKATTFKEVAEKLSTKGVELDNNRFLILQGEVEQIAIMKPKAQTPHETGILEYLEDLIGSDKYVEAIEDHFTQLEALNESRQEKLNRVKHIEKEKNALEGAKTEAVQYLLKEHKLSLLQSKLYQLYKHQSEKEASLYEQERETALGKLEHEQQKLTETEEQSQAMEKRYQKTKKEYDAIGDELEQSKSEFARFERLIIQERENLKHAKTKEKKLTSALKRHQKNKSNLEAKLQEEQETTLPKLEKEKEKVQEKKAVAEEKLQDLFESVKAKTGDIRQQKEQKEKELIPFQQQVNTAQQQLTATEGEIDAGETQVDKATKAYEDAKESLGAAKSSIKKNSSQRVAMQKDFEGQSEHLGVLRQKKAENEQELQSVTQKRNKLISVIEEARATLQAQKGRSEVVSRLMAIKKKSKHSKHNKYTGMCGRLGDLASIDPKYDVAISTACGGLNNIVVDSTATGQDCLQYLKDNNVGRTTFIILNKIQNLRARRDQFSSVSPVSGVKPPLGAKRLYDLLQFDQNYSKLRLSVNNGVVEDKEAVLDHIKNAFYFACRDTLVCKDLGDAMEINKYSAKHMKGKRWRIVTLDGKLVDVSGTMSGGGNRKITGAIKLSSASTTEFKARQAAGKGQGSAMDVDGDDEEQEYSEADVQRMEKIELPKYTNRATRLKQEGKQLDSKIKSCNSKLNSLKTRMKKVQMSLDNADSSIKQAEVLVTRTQEALKEAKAVQQEITDKYIDSGILEQHQTAVEEAQAKCHVIQEALDEMNAQMMKMGGSELKEQKKKVNAINKKMDGLVKDITKLTVGQKTGEKKLQRLEGSIADTEKEMQENASKMKELEESFVSIKKDAKEVTVAYDKANDALEEKGNILQTIQKEYEGIKKVLEKVRSVEVELKNHIEDLQRSIKDNNAKAKHWGKKLTALIKKIDQSVEILTRDLNSKGEEEEKKEGEEEEEVEEDDEDDEEEDTENKIHVDSYTILTTDTLDGMEQKSIEYEMTMLEGELEAMSPNMQAIAEYKKRLSAYKRQVQELDRCTKLRNNARKVYDELRKKRLNEFMAGFTQITMKLKEMYQMLTLGGDAELELVDSLDPFSEGIVFSVRPPKKSWKNIQNLSGGEKTLSSLALVFALHHYKPAPLYVMDEIDAALDFKNVSIVANYIKERTQNAQFVIISLRNNMFELADRLVGIYKTDNCTKSITINPSAFVVPSAPVSASGKGKPASNTNTNTAGEGLQEEKENMTV